MDSQKEVWVKNRNPNNDHEDVGFFSLRNEKYILLAIFSPFRWTLGFLTWTGLVWSGPKYYSFKNNNIKENKNKNDIVYILLSIFLGYLFFKIIDMWKEKGSFVFVLYSNNNMFFLKKIKLQNFKEVKGGTSLLSLFLIALDESNM